MGVGESAILIYLVGYMRPCLKNQKSDSYLNGGYKLVQICLLARALLEKEHPRLSN